MDEIQNKKLEILKTNFGGKKMRTFDGKEFSLMEPSEQRNLYLAYLKRQGRNKLNTANKGVYDGLMALSKLEASDAPEEKKEMIEKKTTFGGQDPSSGFLELVKGVTQVQTVIHVGADLSNKMTGKDLNQDDINGWALKTFSNYAMSGDDLLVCLYAYKKAVTKYTPRGDSFKGKSSDLETAKKYESILHGFWTQCMNETGKKPNETIIIKHLCITRVATCNELLDNYSKLRSSRALPFFVKPESIVNMIEEDIQEANAKHEERNPHYRPVSLWCLLVDFNPKTKKVLTPTVLNMYARKIKEISGIVSVDLAGVTSLAEGISKVHVDWREQFPIASGVQKDFEVDFDNL